MHMKVWILSILWIAMIVSAWGQSKSPGQWVVSGKDAFLVMQPNPIGTGQPTFIKWSSSGKYLLFVRTVIEIDAGSLAQAVQNLPANAMSIPFKANGAAIISVYNSTTQKTTDLYKADIRTFSRCDAAWLPGTETAVALISERTEDPDKPEITKFLRFENGSSTLSLFQMPDERRIALQLLVSDRLPTGVIVDAYAQIDKQGVLQRGTQVVWGIDGQGRLSGPFQLPGGFELTWPEFSDRLGYVSFARVERGSGKPTMTWIEMDLASGQIQAASEPKHQEPAGLAARAIRLDPDPDVKNYGAGFRPIPGGNGSKKNIVPRMLVSTTEQDAPRALVAMDAPIATLSPSLNAVAYVTDDVILVRKLIRLPKSAFDIVDAAEKRMQALSKAKQMGTALLIYAADYDDKLPTDRNLKGIIDPYIKDSDMVDGFNYTFKGGALQDVKSPAETELGYVDGPGGRAVVYVDGHAKWVPNK